MEFRRVLFRSGPGAGALSACPPCSNRSGSSCRRVASPARSANPAGGRKESTCRRGPAPRLRQPPPPPHLLTSYRSWSCPDAGRGTCVRQRSEEHTSELQSLMRISYAVFCLTKKKTQHIYKTTQNPTDNKT